MAESGGSAPVNRFVLLYALAWAGGAIAYTPLLTILLPGRIAALAGADAGVEWLAGIALTGAVAASLGGILFGYLSDVTANRRGWILGGLVLSAALLAMIGRAETRLGLTAAVICWQLALNMMLGPLAAMAGDRVPDDHKGILGGMMAFAPGFGALAGTLITLFPAAAFEWRLSLVTGLVAACVIPVLCVNLPQPVDQPFTAAHGPEDQRHPSRADALRMWLARLAVQIAEACLFSYLYFWLLTLDPATSDHDAARLFSVAMIGSAPVALLAGRWSDRTGRPLVPLQACATTAAAALLIMALAQSAALATAGYLLFGLASAVFLALHSAQTLRVLPRPERRARDLGIFNLANTVPSLVMPWLALGLVPNFGFPVLFAVLAALSIVAALLLRSIARNV